MNFVAVTGDRLTEAAELAARREPTNPFHTREYIASREALGEQPLMLMLEDGGDFIAGCAGFMRSGKVSTQMEISSAPAVPTTSPFWEGLHTWCRNQRVWDLHINTF